jgi:hypothetical protein
MPVRAVLSKVPVVGSVTLVVPVDVRVMELAPLVVNEPAREIAFPPTDATVAATDPDPDAVTSPVRAVMPDPDPLTTHAGLEPAPVVEST